MCFSSPPPRRNHFLWEANRDRVKPQKECKPTGSHVKNAALVTSEQLYLISGRPHQPTPGNSRQTGRETWHPDKRKEVLKSFKIKCKFTCKIPVRGRKYKIGNFSLSVSVCFVQRSQQWQIFFPNPEMHECRLCAFSDNNSDGATNRISHILHWFVQTSQKVNIIGLKCWPSLGTWHTL